MRRIKNLVFQGGGAKGIAYVGALEVLASQGILRTVEHVAGTSAGSLMALFLSIGYELDEIKIFINLDFGQFKDGSSLKTKNFIDIANEFGIHPGKRLRAWLDERIRDKLGKINATFADLHKLVEQTKTQAPWRFRDLHVIGANLSTARAEIFSYYTTPDMPIADAIRISVSIPLVFQPCFFKKDKQNQLSEKDPQGALSQNKEGDVYVDGGVIMNCPTKLFDSDYPNPETLALRLQPIHKIASLRDRQVPTGIKVDSATDYVANLIDTFMGAQELGQIEDNFRTIYIETPNLSLSQFELSEIQKQDLIQRGRNAVQSFLNEYQQGYPKKEKNPALYERLRIEKRDRYDVYAKADFISLHTSNKQKVIIACQFNQDQETKVIKYFNRLVKQAGISCLKHCMSLDKTQLLIMRAPYPLADEVQKWLHKHRCKEKLKPFTDRGLILLRERVDAPKPRWMLAGYHYHSSAFKAVLKAINSNNHEELEIAVTRISLMSQDDSGQTLLSKILQQAQSISPIVLDILLKASVKPSDTSFDESEYPTISQKLITQLFTAIEVNNLIELKAILDTGISLFSENSQGCILLAKLLIIPGISAEAVELLLRASSPCLSR